MLYLWILKIAVSKYCKYSFSPKVNPHMVAFFFKYKYLHVLVSEWFADIILHSAFTYFSNKWLPVIYMHTLEILWVQFQTPEIKQN